MPLPDVGQYLFLKVPEGPHKGLYDSRLQEIQKDFLALDIPVQLNTQIRKIFHVGTFLIVAYSDLDERLPYSFETEVRAVEPDRILVRSPDRIQRIQRRQFARVPVSFPVQMVVADGKTGQVTFVSGTAEDVSGGGMAVRIQKHVPIHPGDWVGLDFQVKVDGQTHRISTKAQVVRIYLPQLHTGTKICGLQFVDLPEQSRQYLIRLVYRRQIELRDFRTRK